MSAIDVAFVLLCFPFAAWCLGWFDNATPVKPREPKAWSDLEAVIASRNGVK